MNNLVKQFSQLNLETLFLVWNPPRGSRRSKQIAQELGIDVEYVYLTVKQGLLYAPVKYIYQGIATLVLLARRRPRLVFVQDPPIFSIFFVYLYSLFSGATFIIDAHTEALHDPRWQWSLPLHRFLSRCALTTIVTNEMLGRQLAAWNVNYFVLPDPPLTFDISAEPMSLKTNALNAVMVCLGDIDEPVAEVTEAARSLPDITFYITGNCERFFSHVVRDAPSNVQFTGYLQKEYIPLLSAADVIVCLTKTNHTFLSGANEALWLGKPLITSSWPILKNYFEKGAIHIDNTTENIQQALLKMQDEFPNFQADMHTLQERRRPEWYEQAEALISLIQQNRRNGANSY